MPNRVDPFRPPLTIAILLSCAPCALAAQTEGGTSLDLSADRVRTTIIDESAGPDPLGRSRGQFDLSAINPSLRLEYGAARNSLLDPNIAFDDLNASQRAERGLAIDRGEEFYDAGLRFDAATIGDVAIVLRQGLRGSLDAPDSSASPIESLRWNTVTGAGLEWRPTRDFFLAGSTLFNLDDDRATLAEVTAELGMRLTPDVSVSLGYRTLDSNFRAPSDAAEDLRDAAFAALRFRF
jgi:hypothetical protein